MRTRRNLHLGETSQARILELKWPVSLRTGHHTPSKASWRRFFQAYIEAFDENGGGSEAALALTSPSAGGAADTPTASGTSTPVPVDTQSGKL